MKYLHPYLFEKIHDLVKERVDSHKFPFVAIENDVMAQIRADIKQSLVEMEQDGLIKRSENINGIGLYRPLKEKDDENNHVQ